MWKQRQISQEFEDNKLELTKLAQVIKQQEEASLEFLKSHEEAVERRNYLYAPASTLAARCPSQAEDSD